MLLLHALRTLRSRICCSQNRARGQSLRGAIASMLAVAGLLALLDQPVRADQITLQMDIHQAGSAAGGNLGYYAFAFLNSTNTPITYYEVYSWNTNYQFVGGVGNGSYTYGLGFGSLGDMLNAFTNGPWKLVLNVGDPSQKTYYFSMSALNFNTNTFPAVHVLSPTDGAVNVTNNPIFTWTGTNNYPEVDVNESGSYQNFYNSATLPPSATNWNPGQPLSQGVFSVDVTYFNSNAPSVLLITTPTNSLGQSPPGWSTVNRLFADDSSTFTVGTVDPSGTAHTLVAYYTWDGTNSDGSASGVDSSGNGYSINFTNGFGAQGGANSTTSAAAGPRAIQFHDGDGSSAGYVGWNPTPAGLLSALSGSFSVSCWIKTTQSGFGWDKAPAYYGAGIVSADNSGLANDVIPLALTGNKIGFNTGGSFQDDTINSATSVNDGNYHHVVVTRNQLTGQKIIYVDGVLDSFSSGTTNLLNDPQLITIGALADASQSDASAANYSNGYDGELDDLQIYSGVLSSNEVAILYANPGTTIPNGGGGHRNVAHYAFDNSGNLGQDSSPSGNNMSGPTFWGPTYQFSTDAEAGGGAVKFFDTSCLYASGQTLTNLNAVLAGSFTFSTWVKTTVSKGLDYNNAFYGATIFWAYNDQDNTNDTIPLSITGSKVAFTTRDHLGNFDTLHSFTSVNDGNYHLITVTRDQATGEKKIYVDGNFETSQLGTTDPLNGDNYRLTIGGWDYCTDGSCTNFYAYNGLLDDLQIYSGVLSDSEVASLYANPGTTIPDITSGSPSLSVTASPLSGLAPLTVQFTSPGVDGAGNTVTNWNWSFGDGGSSTAQSPSYTYNSAGSFSPTLTAYSTYGATPLSVTGLGVITVTNLPDTAPIITLNPFNQTNYPGYKVALLAAATSNPAATWQWFKVGPGLIANATNALYIPTNSGTAGVAGSYYAVASNVAGTANSTTATVSFVSAPLPPDWSVAFKSPFNNNNQPNNEGYLSCLQDSSSNLYAVGFIFGTNSIGSTNYISPNGTYWADIVKQSPTGNALWATGVTNNGNGNAQAYSVVPAPGNGIYVAGNFNGANWLGTNQLTDLSQGTYKSSIFLARLDANGNPLWVRTVSGTNFCFMEYYELVSDPAGNVTLSGLFSGTTIFSSTNPATSTNLFAPGQSGGLAQYDSTGALRWAEITTNWIINMTYNSGRIYATFGNNSTNFYFGSVHVVTDRAKSVTAINEATGQPIWVRGIGAPFGLGNPFNVVLDDALVTVSGTNVFIAGTAIASNAAFGPYTVSWPDYARQYLARCDTNGTPQLLTAFGSDTTMLWSILPASSGGVYVSGDFETYSVFGNDILAGQHLTSIGTGYFTDALLAKFDANGNPLWARSAIPQSNLVNLRGLTAAPDGVWACGVVQSPTSFGSILVGSSLTCIGSPFCTLVYYQSGVLAKITDSAVSALPVTLINPQNNGANFQFQFLSQSGFNHNILYRTNLVVGSWKTNSTVAGDGTLKTILVPLSVFSPSKQGFIRVSTQ